jgi:hypothetical protein
MTQTCTYCHVLLTRHVVWIGNWIYWRLISVTTNNYNAVVNLHTEQAATAHVKYVCYVFAGRCLGTVFTRRRMEVLLLRYHVLTGWQECGIMAVCVCP